MRSENVSASVCWRKRTRTVNDRNKESQCSGHLTEWSFRLASQQSLSQQQEVLTSRWSLASVFESISGCCETVQIGMSLDFSCSVWLFVPLPWRQEDSGFYFWAAGLKVEPCRRFPRRRGLMGSPDDRPCCLLFANIFDAVSTGSIHRQLSCEVKNRKHSFETITFFTRHANSSFQSLQRVCRWERHTWKVLLSEWIRSQAVHWIEWHSAAGSPQWNVLRTRFRLPGAMSCLHLWGQ